LRVDGGGEKSCLVKGFKKEKGVTLAQPVSERGKDRKKKNEACWKDGTGEYSRGQYAKSQKNKKSENMGADATVMSKGEDNRSSVE